MLIDNIIELGAIFLRNLNTNSNNTTLDQWTSGTGYGYYSIPYEVPLEKDHYYYQRYTYKFTTTNQSPTWQQMYLLDGSIGGAIVSNPVAGTEYTASGISLPTIGASYTLTYGTMYNGKSGAISGVTSYVKNVILYDVTELFTLLKMYGMATDSTLKTWCDNNLEYSPRYTNYDISDKFTSVDKVLIDSGTIVTSNFVEPDGMQIYSASTSLKNNTYFDGLTCGISVYNNSGGGTVTFSYVSASSVNSPFAGDHPYCLKITTNGTASPGAGGFYAAHYSAANKVFIERFVAKVPTGYTVRCAYNSLGTGSSVQFITPVAGTGDWAEYAVLYQCGSSGSFSSGGHIYLNGSDNTSVTWYLAYVNNCDITGYPELANYQVLKTKHVIKSDYIFDRCFDACNLVSNGDCLNQETAMLPSGWSYDTEDKAGNAFASIVLPVNGTSGFFGGYMEVNPLSQYKISLWIKCKADMTSYLMYIPYYASDYTELPHSKVNYRANTKTTLASALNAGDTTVTLTDASNWTVSSYSTLGFRNNRYRSSYNNLGLWNPSGSSGCVSSISGNVITLRTAYTGTARAANTCIVESFAGNTYKYPILKSSLPTDNTWKYLEAYFGVTDAIWDGNNAQGNWYALPSDTKYIKLGLNIYSNTGTVPIKYSDIRIEEVSPRLYGRSANKILLETK